MSNKKIKELVQKSYDAMKGSSCEEEEWLKQALALLDQPDEPKSKSLKRRMSMQADKPPNYIEQLEKDLAKAQQKIKKRDELIRELLYIDSWSNQSIYSQVIKKAKRILGSDFEEIIKEKKDEPKKRD